MDSFGGRGNAVFEYRVTKYDPARRDASGAYTRDEWTSVSDLGRAFGGAALTRAEYERVEDAYAAAALAFLREGGVPGLSVAGLENPFAAKLDLTDGSSLSLERAAHVLRRVLREEFWCRLEGAGGFVHVGYDYYMYVGVPRRCPAAEQAARGLGLFPEQFRSPYHPDEAAEPQRAPDRGGGE
jgi:hypothetical protein